MIKITVHNRFGDAVESKVSVPEVEDAIRQWGDKWRGFAKVGLVESGPLPCPYCSYPLPEVCDFGPPFFVVCVDESCNALGPDRPTAEEAIAAWNHAAGISKQVEATR